MSAILYRRLHLSRKSATVVSILAVFASTLVYTQVLRPVFTLLPAIQSSRSRSEVLASLPVAFESNNGQADPSVRYVAHSGSYSLLFAPSAVTLLLETPGDRPQPNKHAVPETLRVSMEFVGANESVTIERGDALAGTVSYLIGDDPSHWHTGLPTFREVTYNSLYNGIDLKYEGGKGTLKGTYIVAPGADPSAIRWRYTGAGAPVLKDGALLIPVSNSHDNQQPQIKEYVPVAWQQLGDQKMTVLVGYVIHNDGSVGFNVESYDPSRPLVIDPTLAYSTYLGGNAGDDGIGVAVDTEGNTYVTGPTGSTNFPLKNPLQPYYSGNSDLFVTKINAEGSALVYSTYLGGLASEISWGMAVDSEGSAYLAGYSSSDDFPVVNAFQSARAGDSDVIVAKINPAGTGLVYSTYLGGKGTDEAWNIAVSGTNAYVTGKTNSTDFPTANAFQGANGGDFDIFLTRFSTTGLSLNYSTYLGGSAHEDSLGVDVDKTGSAYISGGSYSTNYPVLNAFQVSNHGDEDIVLTKLSPSGDRLEYSTYLGGSSGELPWAVAVTQEGDAYVTGVTASADFPVRRAIQAVKGDGLDGFVTRLSKTGAWVVYSTFLGGNGQYDAPYGIVADEAGNSYVTSLVDSTDFPLVNPIQATYGGNGDATISMFGPLGSLLFSTYLGGSQEDFAWRVDLDTEGNLYTTGLTRSPDFPTANAIQPALAGNPDAFVLKITGLPGPTPVPPACNVAFSDVPEGSTFYPYIHCLVCEGLAVGYEDSTYRPNNPTTRGQLSKIVANSAGFSEAVSTQSFEDVPAGSSFYAFVERLIGRGLVTGYPCGGAGEPCVPPGNRPYFRPGSLVTRAQAAKIIAGTAGFPAPPPDERRFEDIPPDHPFFRWVETMAWLELAGGYPCGGENEPCVPPLNLPYFRPGNNITRGQAAKLVASTFLPECVTAQSTAPVEPQNRKDR